MRKLLLTTLLVLIAFQPVLLCAKQKQDPLVSLQKMQNASLLMEKEGKTVISKRSSELMIPASTLKLLTALAAVSGWESVLDLARIFSSQKKSIMGERLWRPFSGFRRA